MKKFTLTDITGTFILAATVTSVVVLFFFFNNGQYIGNFGGW